MMTAAQNAMLSSSLVLRAVPRANSSPKGVRTSAVRVRSPTMASSSIHINLTVTASPGKEEQCAQGFKDLAAIMAKDHPGVIMYAMKRVFNFIELYANNETFVAHLANPKAADPLARVKASLEPEGSMGPVWYLADGPISEDSKKLLAQFGAVKEELADGTFLLNPKADPKSPM
eukprot:jgi/Mesvir1/23795/Mv10609-RA.2